MSLAAFNEVRKRAQQELGQQIDRLRLVDPEFKIAVDLSIRTAEEEERRNLCP